MGCGERYAQYHATSTRVKKSLLNGKSSPENKCNSLTPDKQLRIAGGLSVRLRNCTYRQIVSNVAGVRVKRKMFQHYRQSATQPPARALRDDSKNGYVADYTIGRTKRVLPILSQSRQYLEIYDKKQTKRSIRKDCLTGRKQLAQKLQ